MQIQQVRLVAVSKTKPVEAIQEAYDAGHRDFGENYAQVRASQEGTAYSLTGASDCTVHAHTSSMDPGEASNRTRGVTQY